MNLMKYRVDSEMRTAMSDMSNDKTFKSKVVYQCECMHLTIQTIHKQTIASR